MKIDKDKVVEMDDEEMDDIEDSDLDAFLPKDKTLDQQNKNQASDSESDYEEILDGDDDEEEEEEDEDGDHLDPAFLRQHTKVARVDVAKVVDAIAAQVVVAQIILRTVRILLLSKMRSKVSNLL